MSEELKQKIKRAKEIKELRAKEAIERKKLTEQIKEVSQKPVEKEYIKKISTGCTLLDCVTCGGWPWGKIINIVGKESAGKSYLATETIAHARLVLGDKLKWFYDDAEGGYSFDSESRYGFEMIPEDQNVSSSIEEFAGNFKQQIKKLKEDEYLIYVLDSLDGLSSIAERERDLKRQKAFEKGEEKDIGTYGMEKTKFASEFFRLRASEMKGKNVILMILSQVRHNVGVVYGKQFTRSGGKALDHASFICLWLYIAEKHQKLNRDVGYTMKIKAEKAKIERPFREAFIELLFDYGIDNITSNINFLYDLKTDTGKNTKASKKIMWNIQLSKEKEECNQEFTKEELVKFIENNDFEQILADKVIEKWEAIEAEISSSERKSKWK
jgi:recombination protein RecA